MTNKFEKLIHDLRHVFSHKVSDSTLLGIICHGSATTRHHDHRSDIDFILITTQREYAYHDQWDVAGQRCDLHITNLSDAWTTCQKDMPSNNNLVLDEIAMGAIVFEDGSEIRDLHLHAKQKIEKGPPVPYLLGNKEPAWD